MILTKYDWLNIPKKKKTHIPTHDVFGEQMTTRQIAGLLGMTTDGVLGRLRKGETAEQLVKRGRIRQRRK